MAAAALDEVHATTSRPSERGAQQEDKRAAQGETTQQLAQHRLFPHRHRDTWRCPLLRHFSNRGCHLTPCHFGDMRH
jgi:hypothetical protein